MYGLDTEKGQQVGTVYVDAGMVWVGDPCYVMGDDASSRVHDWIKDFCDKLDMSKSVDTPLGMGTGFAIESGYGDGEYPVYVAYDRDGRVKRITIEFDEDEDVNDDF